MAGIRRVATIVAAFALFVCFAEATKLWNRPLILNQGPVMTLFNQWKQEHSISYDSHEEETARFAIFSANVNKIQTLNDQKACGEDCTFALNKFADYTVEEFKSSILMPSTHPDDILDGREPVSSPVIMDGDLPQAFSWIDKGAVTPIEGQYFLSGAGPLTPFAAEQLVDCDYKDCGVFGGWPSLAFQYIMEAGGLSTEANYPYCSGFGTCYPCMANSNKTFCGPAPSYCNRTCEVKTLTAKISGWTPISKNETEIAFEMMKRGPLSVGLNAEMLQFYHSGIFEPATWLCNPTEIDHAVLLTGWGVDTTILGKEKPWWNVKNSWGPKWGEEGYFRIARGLGTCGINTIVTTAEM